MYKSVARFVMLAMMVQLVPAPLWAQGKKVATVATKTDPAAPGLKIPERTPLAVPELDLFTWRSYGDNPLIAPDMLPPSYGRGDVAADKDTLVDIVDGVVGDSGLSPTTVKLRHDLFWDGAALVFFRSDGQPVPDWFRQELSDKIRSGKVVVQEFRKGMIFWPCGMAWAKKSTDGTVRARFTGNPMVDFDDKLEVYMVDPIYMKSGPYYGHWLAPVIPTKCVNLTCMDSVETHEAYPSEPPSITEAAKKEVEKVAAAPVPPQVIEKKTIVTREKEVKPNHKWLWTAIAIGGGTAVAALFLPKGGDGGVTVVQDARKGTASPGGSPQ